MPYSPFEMRGILSRRALLRGGAVGAAGLAAAALIGCDGDDDEEPAPAPATPAATPTAAAATPEATATPTATAAAPAATPTPRATAPPTPTPTPTPTPDPEAEKRGGEIVTVFFRLRTSWDPHRATSPIQTQDHWGLVGNQLFVPDPETLLAVGDLVTDWEWTGDTTLVANLDPAAKWQNIPPVNGRPFTAADAKFNIDRIAFSEWSPRRALFSTLESVDAVDDGTVQFNLTQPDANFLDALASLFNAMVSPEVAELAGDDLNDPRALIGTGPFLSESHEDGVGGRYVRNPDYWRAGRPYLDAVEYRIIPDDSVQFGLFKAGEIDGPARVWPNSFGIQLQEEEDLTVWHSDGAVRGYSGVVFQLEREPFNDIRLRGAVHLVFNRQALAEFQYEGFASLTTPGGRDPYYTIPDEDIIGQPGFRPDKEADIAQAAQLVQAAVGGELEVPQHTGENYVVQNEVLQAELATIGIKTELKILPGGGIISTEHAEANEDFRFQSTTRGGGDTVDHSFLQTFHPGGSQNPYGIDDPALTAMIEEQRGILDPEERREVYRNVERHILQSMYIAPGLRGQGFMFWKNRVQGYRFGLSGGGNVKAHLFEEIWVEDS
ncbi:MAG: ABC transporter substrate-binding protein [Chloroflexi bacterium]|nr:ABC transporter substrate-binding protein [Chloroflexota bacterium]